VEAAALPEARRLEEGVRGRLAVALALVGRDIRRFEFPRGIHGYTASMHGARLPFDISGSGPGAKELTP